MIKGLGRAKPPPQAPRKRYDDDDGDSSGAAAAAECPVAVDVLPGSCTGPSAAAEAAGAVSRAV